MQTLIRQEQDSLTKASEDINKSAKMALFSDAYQSIKRLLQAQTAASSPHILLQGATGTGKSQLLRLLQSELIHSLPDGFTLFPLNEFEYGVRSISDFYQRLREISHNKLPELLANTQNQQVWQQFVDWAQSQDNQVILVIDNLNYLLKQLDKADYDFFVKTLLNTKQDHYRVIACSQEPLTTSAAFTLITMPTLDQASALDWFEHKILLENSSIAAPNRKVKPAAYKPHEASHILEAIRLMSQANIQTLSYFHQTYLQEPKQSPYHYLVSILTQYQACFDSKMQRLPAQQQSLVHALGYQWQAIKVASMAKTTGLMSKTISAQLHQLEKQNWVEKVHSANKNHYYRLKDDLFQLTYLMRFSSFSQRAALARSTNLVSYLTLALRYKSTDEVNTAAVTHQRERLVSYQYLQANHDNGDVTQLERDALFSHAFTLAEGFTGQTYCDSASHYFKSQLPGERVTFLLNAASRGYEQAYIGLLSLLNLAQTPVQESMAYQIKIALCQSAINKGFAFDLPLLAIMICQGIDSDVSFELAQTIKPTLDSGKSLILKSFAALWHGENTLAKTHFKHYLGRDLNEENRSNPEAPITDQDGLICELILLFMARQEWHFLSQVFTLNPIFKANFLALYYGFLSLKPEPIGTEYDDYCAMPTSLKQVLPLIHNKVLETQEKYNKEL